MVHCDLNSHEPLFKVSWLQVCDVWDHVSDADRPLGMMSPVTWWSSLARELAAGLTQVPMNGVFFGGGEILSTPNDSFVIGVSFAYINNLSQLVYFLTMNNLVHLFAFCPLSLLKSLFPVFFCWRTQDWLGLGFLGIVGFTPLEDSSSACVDALIRSVVSDFLWPHWL